MDEGVVTADTVARKQPLAEPARFLAPTLATTENSRSYIS